jgi:myo-inositol-1-phosphate synthase
VQLVASAKASGDGPLPGLARPMLAGFGVSDISFVAAFEVDRRKIGVDLSVAALHDANAAKRHLDVSPLGVRVEVGPLADGIEGKLAGVIVPHPAALDLDPSRVVETLQRSKADVLICHLPTGAHRAVRIYAEAAARAGVGMINTTPEVIARDPEIARMFFENGAQLLGDDTKSMLGATTVHMTLIELLRSKGVDITGTYQINIGGNTDFLNLSDPMRCATKVQSKRTALAGAGIDASQVLAGPNGHAAFLGDTKVCHLRLNGRSVLGSPVSIDLTLQVEDSPNSAGVIVDAIRVAKAARIKGMRGTIAEPCAMLFKSPPAPVSNTESVRLFDAFVAKLSLAPNDLAISQQL